MLKNTVQYRLPDAVNREFAAYALKKGADIDPYHQDSGAFRSELALKLRALLKEVPADSPDHAQASAILKELNAQRLGKGALAFVIDNLPIDPDLPATPQSRKQLPVGEKSTFVSEAIHLALMTAMGQRPYRQKGMQGGHEITQVIPMSKDPHEQSNTGHGVLALHTEISSAPGHETPQMQSLLGLRGGTNVSVAQTVITTLVPVKTILEQLSDEEIKVLSMPIFHFSSGPAIDKDSVIERTGPVISIDPDGHSRVRFHADPVRMRPMDGLEGNSIITKAVDTARAQKALDHLRDICNVLQHPEFNASAIRLDPGRGLFWHNQEMLHGRGDIKTLLENALKEEEYSVQLVKELFPKRSGRELLEEYNREKELGQLTGAGKDTAARWVQRGRGLPTHHRPGVII